jgi:hypothetical protein
LNSENIFAVLNRLGIRVADAGTTCAIGQRCVPCLNSTCFPPDSFDRLWYMVRRPGQSEPLVFAELRYGVGWSPAPTQRPTRALGRPPGLSFAPKEKADIM